MKTKQATKKNPRTQNSLYLSFEITLDIFTNLILHQNPKDLQRHKEKSTFDWPLAH